jgi:lysine/ornithine N-monooxygenase
VQRLQRKADLETATAGRLLAEAAESLSLPSSAGAEDIALAAGKRPYLPPAVQKLLHAARLREEKSDDHQ